MGLSIVDEAVNRLWVIQVPLFCYTMVTHQSTTVHRALGKIEDQAKA